jgi:hypothetical protein
MAEKVLPIGLASGEAEVEARNDIEKCSALYIQNNKRESQWY